MSDADEAAPALQDSSLAMLLTQVAAGSRPAFEALYRHTSSKLFGVCLRVLADRPDAEDALQDTFTTIWRKARQFDSSRAAPLAWLTMIARNKAIDRLRARAGAAAAAPIELAEALEDPRASPLQAAQLQTERARLENCLRQLEARRGALIRAAFFDGATYEELARRIGSPLGSVKSWIRRALLQLRACLQLP